MNELVSISPSFGNQQQNVYKHKVEKSVLVFISKLADKPNVTSSLLQEIILGVIEIISCGVISDIKNKVMPILRECNKSKNYEIENMFDILEHACDYVKTKYHRTKFFIKNNLFFKPKTVIGHYKEKQTKNNINTVSMVPVHYHLLL